MSSSLSGFSTAQLQAEIEKRKAPDYTFGPGMHFYYRPLLGDNTVWDGSDLQRVQDDGLQFCIVHKRYWHIMHCLPEGFVSEYAQLPDAFEEGSSGCFEYTGDDILGAEPYLNAYKYTRAPRLHEYKFTLPFIDGASVEFHCSCDSQEMRNGIVQSSAYYQTKPHISIDTFVQNMHERHPSHAIVMTYCYGDRVHLSFIECNLLSSLPELPSELSLPDNIVMVGAVP